MKVVLLFLIFTILPKAFAFEWGLHRSITARALLPLGFSIKAMDQVADGNIYIDIHEGSNTATHVDSESFEAASALIRLRLSLTAMAVIDGDMKKARETFGYITHTVQDFYAHTNYVEYMPGKPIDLLHLTNPSSDVTCSANNVINGLTSGYYPDSSTPARKCSHSTLNKDSGNFTPAGAKAFKYAEIATAQIYKTLEQEVISMSADQQRAIALLARFRSEDSTPYQQYNLEGHDDVTFAAYNETFKVTPFFGITNYTSNEFYFESRYTAGLRVEAKINEKFASGIGLTHNTMTIKEFDYSSYGVDLYSKLYLIQESRFQPYLGAGVEYLKSTLKNNDSSDTSTLNGEVMGGMDLMFVRRMGINLEVKYVRPFSTSSYTQSFGTYATDKLARDIENSDHFVLSAGMILSF